MRLPLALFVFWIGGTCAAGSPFLSESTIRHRITSQLRTRLPSQTKVQIEAIFLPTRVPSSATLVLPERVSTGSVVFTFLWTDHGESRQIEGRAQIRAKLPTELTPERAVTGGKLVDLVHEQGNLKIVAKVKALEDGQISEWIHVENPTTRKVLLARVTAPGEVQLR